MYKLEFLRKAVDDLKKIDKAIQKVIKGKLLILAKNPLALKNNIKLIGDKEEKLYRLRVGSYRVIFKRKEKELIIIIVRIGHRKEIYLSLK